MNSRRRPSWRALRLALPLALAALPVAAAGGIDGAAHAFRGDVLIVHGTKLLLFGVTAPTDDEACSLEGGTACAEAAKAGLAAVLAPGPVSCSFLRKIGHGSYQGTCRGSDAGDIGLALLRQGWLRADAEASPDYRAAEAEAKAAGRGIWASGTD